MVCWVFFSEKCFDQSIILVFTFWFGAHGKSTMGRGWSARRDLCPTAHGETLSASTENHFVPIKSFVWFLLSIIWRWKRPVRIRTALSTVHRHIFIFEKNKNKKGLCTIGDDVARAWDILHRWGELMIFIPFIFHTLCTLIQADADYTARIMFHSASVFLGNFYLSHSPSLTKLQHLSEL